MQNVTKNPTINIIKTVGAVIIAMKVPVFIGNGGVDMLSIGNTD